MRTSLLLIAVGVLSACGDDASHAPLSRGGRGPEIIRVAQPDGGENVNEDDAGSTPDAGPKPDAGGDGRLPLECMRTTAMRITSDEMPVATAIESPSDFFVTRQAATWNGNCASPLLVIELSNGVCPNGAGHELEFTLPANAIADGQIGFGLNTIGPELDTTDSIRVRYTRPQPYAPVGVYGTCEAGGGQISFFEVPDITRAMNIQARFELVLEACDGKPNPAQVVSGYVDVRVRRSLTDYCPR